MAFNNNNYAFAVAPIQPSSGGPELESVGVFLNHLYGDTSNRHLADASLGRYDLFSLRMRKLCLLKFNVVFFIQ